MIAAARYSRSPLGSLVIVILCLGPLAAVFLVAWIDTKFGPCRAAARQPHMAASARHRRTFAPPRANPLLARPTRLLVPTPPALKPSANRGEIRRASSAEREARRRGTP